MAKIFLSYASEDRASARDIYERLQERGHQPWMDKIDLLPGQRWEQEIPKAIRGSDFILIFFSKQSVNKRGYVQREFKLVLDTLQELPENIIHTIPIRLDDCNIPSQFSFLHWSDLFEGDGFDKLMRAIQTQVGERPKPPVLNQNPQLDNPQENDPRISESSYIDNSQIRNDRQTLVLNTIGRMKVKLFIDNKYLILSMIIGGLLVLSLFIYLQSNNELKNLSGGYLLTDIQAGEKITDNIVEIRGDINLISDAQPVKVEHVVGFCAIHALQEGTQLTLNNIMSCVK